LTSEQNVLKKCRPGRLGGAVAILLAAALRAGAVSPPPIAASGAVAAGVPVPVAEDVNGVEEPSTVALRMSGVTHQVTAFIRRISVPPAVFHVRDEWASRDSNGLTYAGQFALPDGYTDSSDPVLAKGATRSTPWDG